MVEVGTLGLTKAYQLQSPWSDASAQFVKPPLAATKIAALFPKKQGPNAFTDPMKPKEFAKVLEAALTQVHHQQVQKRQRSGEGGTAADIVADIHSQREAERKKKMEALREKAKEQMDQRAAKTVYTLPS